jgi:predicted transcriptional regulator
MATQGDLTKEELREIIQTIRDIEKNDKTRSICLMVYTTSLSKAEIEEVLSQIKPKLETHSWIDVVKPPERNGVV